MAYRTGRPRPFAGTASPTEACGLLAGRRSGGTSDRRRRNLRQRCRPYRVRITRPNTSSAPTFRQIARPRPSPGLCVPPSTIAEVDLRARPKSHRASPHLAFRRSADRRSQPRRHCRSPRSPSRSRVRARSLAWPWSGPGRTAAASAGPPPGRRPPRPARRPLASPFCRSVTDRGEMERV